MVQDENGDQKGTDLFRNSNKSAPVNPALRETGIVGPSEKPLDANSLSDINMPNRSNFVPANDFGVILPRISK